jgi:hypothetical protein
VVLLVVVVVVVVVVVEVVVVVVVVVQWLLRYVYGLFNDGVTTELCKVLNEKWDDTLERV